MGFGTPAPTQGPPQPWNSTSQTLQPRWFRPYVEQGMGLQGDILNDRLAGRGAPPTLEDVLSGRYRSSYGGTQRSSGPLDFSIRVITTPAQ